MNGRLLLIFWAAWAIFAVIAFAFVVFCPAVWATLVDRENEYWVRRGWLSRAFAEKAKAIEKGSVPKLLLGGVALISVTVICVLLHARTPRPFRALPPPAPVLRRFPRH